MSDTSSEASSIEGEAMEEITLALSKCFSNSTYTCGGTAKIQQSRETRESEAEDQAQTVAEPITIRWDSATSIEKLILPLSDIEGNKEHSAVSKLAAATQPASFGFKGKDVIDESYRKASKLDTSAFSTNFCPYESGIIDVIGQTLLPKSPYSYQGIRAELYKLNVGFVLGFHCTFYQLINDRSIKLRLISSNLMSTPRVQSSSLAHSWCVYPVITKAVSLLCVMKVTPQRSTGPARPRMSNGRRSTVTASMRSTR
jgi:hypothetical protein